MFISSLDRPRVVTSWPSSGQFKNLAQRAAWTRGVEGRFWQPSFWDHFVRRDEDLRSVIEYVLDNPVRAGLVAVREEYPFAGSSLPESSEAGDEPPPYPVDR